MKKRKLASIVLSAAICVFGSAAMFSIVACSKTDDPEENTPVTPTPEQPVENVSSKVNGAFYFEGSNGQENLLTLKDDLKFSLIVNGDVYTGSYTLFDSTLTLTSESDTWTGTYSADKVSLSYNNQALTFIKKVSYTITFEVSGGSTVQSVSVVNGKSVDQPDDPTRDGYVFLGWYEDNTYTSTYTFSQVITQDTTVYAKWAQKVTGQAEYTIDFDLGYSGATAIASVQTIGGKLYNEPAPTREGYTFSGWAVSMYDSADKISYMYNGNIVFAEDTTLHAVWTSNESSSKLASPLVNVASNLISWGAVSGASTYNLKITGPEGYTAVDKNTGSTSEVINFAELPAGDYVITVTAVASNTANNSTATSRYYLNKALNRVSAFEVVDPSVLSFNAVPNAQKYLISIECGNDSHTHTLVDNGSSTQYNFANCEMKAGGIKFTVTAVADGYANSVSRTFTYERKLGAISGFAFDEATQTLSWDAVASATSYEVKVVGAETTTVNIGNKTSFSLKNFDAVEGGLKISVTPKTYGYVSPDATVYTFNKANLASPTDIRITGDTLSWKEVKGATKYTVSIGGQTFVATTNSFNLKSASTVTWTTGSDYSITVTANSDTVASSIASDVVDARYYALYSTMSYDNSTLTWRHVVGATKYEVAVNDGDPFEVTEGKNFADITLTKAGENTLSVRFYQGDTYSDWVSLSVYAYQIVFDSNGGSTPATMYKAVGDKIELPESTKTGYNFAGWYNVSGGADDNGAKFEQDTLENAKNLRLYAYFTSKEYTVTYVFGDDATGSKLTDTVKFGKDYSLIVPTTTDGTKAFMGWSMYEDGSLLYTNEKGEGLSTWSIAKDITLYAYWSKQFSFQLTTVNGISGEVYSVSQGDAENMVGEITIPATYKGVHVAMVEANAFKNCNSLTVINIPNTVQLISSATPFDGCDSLEAVNIIDVEGNNLVRYWSKDGVVFDKGAVDDQNGKSTVLFVPLAKTGSFTIPDSVETISSKSFYKSALSEIVIPASVKTIGSYAFSECENLSVITFTEPAANAEVNNLTIGAKAFSFDTSLTQITLPARLTNIALTRYNISGSDVSLLGAADGVDDAFYGTNLVSINVATGNTNYKSTDGILFSNGGATLLYVPSAKNVGEYAVASSVTAIADGAFVNNDTVTSVTIHNMLTSVGECAFYKCTKLTAVTFEGDAINTKTTVGKYAFRESGVSTLTFGSGCAVTTIGEGAFMGTSITTLTVPSSMTTISKQAFKDCTSLGSIQFTDNTNNELSIGDGAFDGCTSLTTIHLTAGISTFPGFDGCSSLNTITVDENNPNYTSENGILYNKDKTVLCYYPKAREGAFTVPSSVTTIAESAFADNTAITSITISANVTKIGKNAFKGCTNLTEVSFVNGDKDLEIADYAFANSGITSFTMPERAKTLGKYLFSETKSLNSIMLSNSMSKIPDYTFYESSLATIYIPDNIVTIGEAAFASSDIETVRFGSASLLATIGVDAFALTSSLTNIELPASLKTIGAEAFYGAALTTITFATGSQLEIIDDYAFIECKKLSAIIIPNTVKVIGQKAFDGTEGSSLASVTFEAGGTEDLTIGVRAFKSCSKLTSLALPARTKIIYDNAFYSCSGLTSVTFADNGETSRLQTIGSYAFYYCKLLTSITIPQTVGNYTYTLEDGSQKTYIGIGSNAFQYNYALTTVTFDMGGDNLLSIGDYAFGSCSLLESITFPERLSNATALTSYAFYSCSSLKTIKIESYEGKPEKSDYVAVDNVIYNSAKTQIIYCAAKNAATIHIPSTITAIPDNAFNGSTITGVVFDHGDEDPLTIGAYAFYGCTNITSVTLAPSVKTLGNKAFADCTNLENVTLSKSFETFDTSAFSGCSKLTTITVADGNTNYSSADGVLFNADKTILLSYLSTKTDKEYTIPSTVTTIAESAFSGNAILEKVTIPASVTLINDLAFFNCTKLKTVEFATNRTEDLVIGKATTSTDISYIGSNYNEYGANVFAYCTSLETIELPEKTTSLGSGVFYNCTSLISASLPSTLKTMGKETFYGCSKLATVTFADNCALDTIPEKTFYSCRALTTIRIPAAVEKISFSSSYYGAFYYSGLTSVTFEANSKLTEIGNNAFSGLSSLASIVIPATVTKIGDQAFYGCNSLTSITIPDAVETIGEKAFSGCSKATSLTIGSSLKTIGNLALYNLGGLNSITVDTANTYFKSLGNCLISNDGKLLLGSNKSVIPNDGTVTAIANYAFYGCAELTTLTLPDGLLSIGYQVFDGCSKLTYTESGNAKYLGSTQNPYMVLVSATSTSITSCEINANTKFIYYQAFYNCSALGSIVIPANMVSIGDNAFYGCSNLLEVQNLSALQIQKGSSDNGRVAYYALSVYGAGEQSSIRSTSDGFKYSVDGENVILVAYVGTETTITLPTTLEGKTYSIYAGIFAGNTTLVSVTIPEGVTAIPANAFNGCTSLTTVSLPSTLTTIGENAFYGCTALASITIPAKVTTIGNYAFYNCTGLTEINLNATVNDYSSTPNVFYNAGTAASGITLNIGANVTKIANYLFYCGSYYAPKITSIVFAENSQCTTIGRYAFYYLNYVTTLVLPDSVTTLEYEAIDTCSNLEYLVIGKNVTSFGTDCFYSVNKLNAVYFNGNATELSNSIVNTYSKFSSKTKLYYSETEASGAWRYVDDVPTAW